MFADPVLAKFRNYAEVKKKVLVLENMKETLGVGVKRKRQEMPCWAILIRIIPKNSPSFLCYLPLTQAIILSEN